MVLGAIKARDLLDQAEQAEASGVFDAVWVGDSLLAKPRLESVTLLSALAGVTRRMRLAVGCMATFVHRHPVLLAQQWASLDVLSEGRALLAVCLGGPDSANAAQAAEHAVMGIASGERVERLEEGIAILRKLFGEHERQSRRAASIGSTGRRRAAPGPAAVPDLDRVQPDRRSPGRAAPARPAAAVERGLRRVARYADGWMTNKLSPDEFRRQFGHASRRMAREEGRDPAALGSALYHNINVNEDRQAALAESKAFLDAYYTAKFSPEFVEQWTVAGGPKECAEQLRAYFAAGARPHGPAPGLVGPGRPARALPGRGRPRAVSAARLER